MFKYMGRSPCLLLSQDLAHVRLLLWLVIFHFIPLLLYHHIVFSFSLQLSTKSLKNRFSSLLSLILLRVVACVCCRAYIIAGSTSSLFALKINHQTYINIYSFKIVNFDLLSNCVWAPFYNSTVTRKKCAAK